MSAMLGALAAGGPATGPTWSTVLGTWRTTWGAELAVTALAALYLRTALRVGGWPVARTVSSSGALAVVVVAVDSGVGVYAPTTFAVRVVMHLALLVVVPALWVAGRPLELLRHGGSARLSAVLDRLRGGAVSRALTWPPAALVLWALVVVLTHLTAFPVAVATEPAAAVLDPLLCLGAGLLLLHTALGLDRCPERPSYAVRFSLLLLAAGVLTAVGVVLAAAPAAVLPGLAPDDVRRGGTILGAAGDGLLVLIMLALGHRWVGGRAALARPR